MIDSIISHVVCDCGYKHFHSIDKQYQIYDPNFTNLKNKNQ